jgi:Domain of unknown function (DUF3291)
MIDDTKTGMLDLNEGCPGEKEGESMSHLAQVNIARMVAPLSDPLMAGFVAKLDEVNALADASPGFIWRLQTPEGNATAFRAYEMISSSSICLCGLR